MEHMTLGEYVEKHGVSVKRELQKKTGLRWQTIHEIALGNTKPTIETAKKLSKATGGEVRVVDLRPDLADLLDDTAAA